MAPGKSTPNGARKPTTIAGGFSSTPSQVNASGEFAFKTHAPLVPVVPLPPCLHPHQPQDLLSVQLGAQALVSWVTPGHENQPLQTATFGILLP